jgi:hypothetical protein
MARGTTPPRVGCLVCGLAMALALS